LGVFNFEQPTIEPFDIIPPLRSILAWTMGSGEQGWRGKLMDVARIISDLRPVRESIAKAIPSLQHLSAQYRNN
jgi:hypothetical protein